MDLIYSIQFLFFFSFYLVFNQRTGVMAKDTTTLVSFVESRWTLHQSTLTSLQGLHPLSYHNLRSRPTTFRQWLQDFYRVAQNLPAMDQFIYTNFSPIVKQENVIKTDQGKAVGSFTTNKKQKEEGKIKKGVGVGKNKRDNFINLLWDYWYFHIAPLRFRKLHQPPLMQWNDKNVLH